jgi:AAA domain
VTRPETVSDAPRERFASLDVSEFDDDVPGALVVQTLDEFADELEDPAVALLGTADNVLIPENGDAMAYGDGGAGKTTMMIDLALHLAAGDPWLVWAVPRPLRVLLIENEGPRPFFRAKLRRKRDAWTGSALGDRLLVLAEPWGRFTYAKERCREVLADWVREREIDVVISGPLTTAGMEAAGTLQEVRAFLVLVDDVRRSAGRPFASVLVHHENKGGQVSGAWEGAGDTLLHVSAQGRGRSAFTSRRPVTRARATGRRSSFSGPRASRSRSRSPQSWTTRRSPRGSSPRSAGIPVPAGRGSSRRRSASAATAETRSATASSRSGRS